MNVILSCLLRTIIISCVLRVFFFLDIGLVLSGLFLFTTEQASVFLRLSVVGCDKQFNVHWESIGFRNSSISIDLFRCILSSTNEAAHEPSKKCLYRLETFIPGTIIWNNCTDSSRKMKGYVCLSTFIYECVGARVRAFVYVCLCVYLFMLSNVSVWLFTYSKLIVIVNVCFYSKLSKYKHFSIL